jgi:CBS domain-containing protein
MRPVYEQRVRVPEETRGMTLIKEMRVRDFMVVKPVVFRRGTDLLDAVRILVDKRISGAPVVDERGNLVGVLTERDFLKAALVAGYHGEGGGCVGDYMSSDVQAVNAEDSLLDVATRFVDTGYRRFPVMEDNRVVGLVTRQDVLRTVIDAFETRPQGSHR